MNTTDRRSALLTVLFLLAIVSTVTAKYSEGSGTAQAPYQVAAAADLITLDVTPADYGKHFVLTVDLDLGADPPCSYSWQFSTKPVPVGWDPTGRTLCRDWKAHQVKALGGIVPMVRCNHRDQYLNLAVVGQIWWSLRTWEYIVKPGYRFSPEEVPRGN